MKEIKVEKQIVAARMDAFLNKPTTDRKRPRRTYISKAKKKSRFSNSLKTALAATFIIALLIGASVLLPLVALTGGPIILLLGILAVFFLIFFLVEHFR